MIGPIVLATDFSPISSDALAHAIELARRWRAPMRLLHVIESGVAGAAWIELPHAMQMEVTDRTHVLLRERADIVRHAGIQVEIATRRGIVADEILKEVETVSARAVVMGTHGYGLFRRFFVGSVATRVLRAVDCPALIVPPNSVAPPWDGILFPVDFSPACDATLDTAIALAETIDTPLEFFHVAVPHHTALMAYGLGDALVYDLETQREEIDTRLGEISARSRHRGVTTTTGCKMANGRGEAIVERADSAGHGLIVMAAHGRRGFQRAMFGSVTEDVMRHTDRPLLILRSKAPSGDSPVPHTTEEANGHRDVVPEWTPRKPGAVSV